MFSSFFKICEQPTSKEKISPYQPDQIFNNLRDVGFTFVVEVRQNVHQHFVP